MIKNINELRQGMETAFIDCDIDSNLACRPEFVSNDHVNGKKVITSIERELLNCDSFIISVAFITKGGITPLLQTFAELEEKNIPGRILTTDYLTFSDPEALSKLAGLKNIDLRMYETESKGEGFHTKGYIFKNAEIYSFIVGSSNMTLSALTENKEWNSKVISTAKGSFAKDILEEFYSLWDSENTKKYSEFIGEYSNRYAISKEQRRIAAHESITSIEDYKLTPNKMQTGFIERLDTLRNAGMSRGLLISATGTGKTYASAFAMRAEDQKRVLFVVHREQIAKQALKSFKKVFGSTRTYGMLTGNSKDHSSDFIFATIQTLSHDDILNSFQPDEFQTIIIDEVHRVGAESYGKVMNYFKPEFFLGMTASPERTDNFDVFAEFDHNIIYEIRLQQALEENLLCPFHYFGITDIEIDGKAIDDETGLKNFNLLTSKKRVEYILQQAEFYGHSGDRVKGLIFCSTKREAIELSQKINQVGLKTEALTGEDSQERREEIVDRLVNDDRQDKLDYILTVDIFNEGVDIPEVNQISMLRPTQSPIVFVQQLGRGLRNAENKDYVVILDFIGNYKNNFMIPIALSGDRSYNKDNIRHYVLEGERIIPGASTIHFDAISRKRIFEAIDNANFSDIRFIKDNYRNLKNKLGRIPSLKDFDDYGELDVERIFDNASLGSYYKFLVKYEPDYKVRLNEKEEKTVEFISKKLASGKRIEELELLKRVLLYQSKLQPRLIDSWRGALKNEYHINPDLKTERSVVNVLSNQFPAGSSKTTYKNCVLIERTQDGNFSVNNDFAILLHNREFFNIVLELVNFGIDRYKKNYSNHYKDTDFVLYKKYTYEDVCRLLNWKQNVVPLNIGGYKYDEDTHTFPVFINYDKADTITDTTKYEDRFINNRYLKAISKNGRTLESQDVSNFIYSQQRGIKVELFVRKNKDDATSKEFYFLGEMKPTGNNKQITISNTDKTAVEIEWKLDTPVREDIYEYIVNN